MPSINDWAAKCAEYIEAQLQETDFESIGVERLAAIIDTFARPLTDVLRESIRTHRHDEEDGGCCPQCDCISRGHSEDDDEWEPEPNWPDMPCDCGADAWNARIDGVLSGVKIDENSA